MCKSIGILLLLVISACSSSKKSAGLEQNTSSDKLRICPDEWIENRMPGPNAQVRQYFIIEGERKEIDAYDLEWIKKNCTVKEPQIVY